MNIQYTKFTDRLFAGIIDGVVILPISVASTLLVDVNSQVSFLISGVFEAAIFYFYSIFMHFRYGQTFGKMALNIKVIHANEKNISISLRQAFMRDSVPLVLDILIFLTAAITLLSIGEVYSKNLFGLPIIVWFFIELITMLTNKRRRAAHDFLANTVVVMAKKEKLSPTI